MLPAVVFPQTPKIHKNFSDMTKPDWKKDGVQITKANLLDPIIPGLN